MRHATTHTCDLSASSPSSGGRSGGYGFAVERSIAYAYLPGDRSTVGTRGEVEVFGEWVGCTVVAEPIYDPKGMRIRA